VKGEGASDMGRLGMGTNASISMTIADWVQNVLSGFEDRVEPHNEVQIADALDAARRGRGDLGDEEWKGYVTERSAFLFMERPDEDSLWNTYFAPMFTGTQTDGKEVRVPDVEEFDPDVIAHWKARAKSVRDPVMRARYADLVWDLERVVTKERRQYEYAGIAVDAYVESTTKRLYPMDIEGVGWLKRALNLSLSIGDKGRQKQVIHLMFALYGEVVDPRHIGVWIFPFDCLYGRRGLLTPEQEARIVTDLEKMLARTSGRDKPEEFDPFGAQAAAERLAQHYKKQNDKPDVERVIKTYGHAFEEISRDASPMLAMAWLQPVVERYEQEGLKQEAEQLQIMSAEKGKSIADDMKQVAVSAEVKREDIDKLIDYLIGGADLKTSLHRVAGYFIPKAKDAKELLERMKADAPLMSMIPIVMIEGDGRPTAKIGSVDEDAEGRLHRQLGQTIGFYQPFLTHALERLRQKDVPTVENIFGSLVRVPIVHGEPPRAITRRAACIRKGRLR
jgi:hypothetical protein